MKHIAGILAAATLAQSVPAVAQDTAGEAEALARGFDGALRGCEAWVLHPDTWAGEGGDAPFREAVGLGGALVSVPQLPEVALPPEELREGLHYWRIDVTLNAGYFLVVSDQVAMCHVTGGGNADLQPVVEALLASETFLSRWTRLEDLVDEDIESTLFENREDAAMQLVVSRSTEAGGDRDRVQLVATAQYFVAASAPE